MHEDETLANDRLQKQQGNVNKENLNVIIKNRDRGKEKSKRTPPGINSPDITAPSLGTIRG
jgi:hypothetical protein